MITGSLQRFPGLPIRSPVQRVPNPLHARLRRNDQLDRPHRQLDRPQR